MLKLPDVLESGDPARLFPVVADTSKEQRAASIFLSVISAVPAFANALLNQVGQRIGPRSSLNTFTEVVLKNRDQADKKDRPDGFIEVATGNRTWTALLEEKVGNNTLEKDQIERYVRLSRDNSLDAVITISNEFAAHPAHHPIQIAKTLTRKVSLYHFSWTAILTEAVLIHERSLVADPEQAFLIREFIRYFSHDSVGVNGFTSMPAEWSEAIERIRAGGRIRKGELDQQIVWGWHQELRDLTLIMSRTIGCNITTKLSKISLSDPEKRISDDIERLCNAGMLEASLQIPDAAADMKVVADLRSRSIRISMSLDAPKDRKTSKARLNWLLRQIKMAEPNGVSISAVWASRAANSVYSLAEIRDQPEKIDNEPVSSNIRAFEVTLTSDSARRFVGRKTFIEDLELLAQSFYERVGQHLSAWKPSPPKPMHSIKDIEKESAQTTPKPTVPQPGNAHSDLLEIPVFLRRASF
ncbi:MAG: hypothetical protein GKS00_22140 [Alphaproteobacteria bacterium]|nr:hypothetical protein [Alphaproteobacteria bacterium]